MSAFMTMPVRWSCVASLLVLVIVGQANADKRMWTIYRLDEDGRYLEIAPNPPGSGSGGKTRHTKSGERSLYWTCGDCESIFQTMHLRKDWECRHVNLGPYRVVVETKNPHYYSVVYDDCDKAAFKDTANQLGLEVAVEKRPIVAWILESTGGPTPGLEPYRGKSKWPHLKVESASDLFRGAHEIDKGLYQGSVYYKGNVCYFDGVTFDEFARFIEEEIRIPVANKTGRKGRYSFILPMDFWKEFVFGEPPAVLEPIGIKVPSSNEEELDVVVVRDKPEGATGERPLPAVTIEAPAGCTERIPELLGKWRTKAVTIFGERFPVEEVRCYDLYYDGHGFHQVDAKGNVLEQSDGLEVWKMTRWGKFYRATRFEFFGGEWDVAGRVLLRLDGNTLTCCSVEGKTPFPKDFSREETIGGGYIIFERMDDTSGRVRKWRHQERLRRCRHHWRGRCRHPLRQLRRWHAR